MPSLLQMLDWFALPKFRRQAVSESDMREGLEKLADAYGLVAKAIETHAAVLASCAAAAHSKDYPGQRDMAEVIFADALTRFEELLNRAGPERQKRLDEWINGLCKGKRR